MLLLKVKCVPYTEEISCLKLTFNPDYQEEIFSLYTYLKDKYSIRKGYIFLGKDKITVVLLVPHTLKVDIITEVFKIDREL